MFLAMNFPFHCLHGSVVTSNTSRFLGAVLTVAAFTFAEATFESIYAHQTHRLLSPMPGYGILLVGFLIGLIPLSKIESTSQRGPLTWISYYVAVSLLTVILLSVLTFYIFIAIGYRGE
jgi:hypothetical protein